MNSPLFELLEARRFLNAQGWSDTIDNPYFPLIPGTTWVYKGVRDGEAEKNRVIVTTDTKQILGVTCTVVFDRVYIGGELAEKTYDWYAQDAQGNVWYFGEDSRDIENGKVVSREGTWEAGVAGAKAGIIMKRSPGVGDAYFQEFQAGVAEDQGEVLSLHDSAKTPFGSFGDCVKTKDFTQLEPNTTENKWFAPGIGFVKSIASGDESEVIRLESFDLAPQAFASTIDNPYFPLTPGTTFVYKGQRDGEAETDRFAVTTDTKQITGVTCTVVHDRVFIAGELAEKTYDWFAQDKIGNVWYFGEDSRDIENGKVVSREGSWEAGVNGAKAGIIMKAFPGAGDGYFEEHATGVAEDQAEVLGLHEAAKTPFATFGECLKTRNFTLLEPASFEHKFYAAGIGFVKSEAFGDESEVLRLVDIIR